MSYLAVAWETVLKKVMEIPSEAIPGFFESNHQVLIHVTWALVIIHILTLILGPLRDFLKPRWYSHLAIIALAWAVFGQTTFAPPGLVPAAQTPKEKSSSRTHRP